MTNAIGPLIPADERLCHQITDTFAVVASTDFAWTEKVCAMAAARDGSLQLAFGLGKYTNRNVMDAYAGVSRGVEQIDRARQPAAITRSGQRPPSGRSATRSSSLLQQIRFVLEPNDVQPIAFDWLFEARPSAAVRGSDAPPRRLIVCRPSWFAITRSALLRLARGRRRTHRHHARQWVSTRDHSWGVRYGVGTEPNDLEPPGDDPHSAYHFFWTPSLLERSDGSVYGVFMAMNHFRGTGYDHKTIRGTIEHPDGSVDQMANIIPELHYDPVNRRLLGGQVHCTMNDGSSRTLQVDVVSDTGFHLGTGLYFGFNGHHHGEWRGKLHIEGERIDDCASPGNAAACTRFETRWCASPMCWGRGGLWQWQPIAMGSLPELGLDASTSFT